MDNQIELVKNWLIKSQNDLLAAIKLSDDPEIYGDTAIYHCQQSAEKAVRPSHATQPQKNNPTHRIRD
jgi:hypothetical protein